MRLNNVRVSYRRERKLVCVISPCVSGSLLISDAAFLALGKGTV